MYDLTQVKSSWAVKDIKEDGHFSLLEMTKEVDYDSWPFIRPICLPFDDEIDYTYLDNCKNCAVLMTGWGHNDNDDCNKLEEFHLTTRNCSKKDDSQERLHLIIFCL